MKEMIKQYDKKRKELETLERRHSDLLQEESTSRRKLLESKRLLLDTEVSEIELLRRIWSARKINQSITQIESGENAPQANDCNPVDIAGELNVLRREVDVALRGLYPSKEAQAALNSTERLRESVKKIEEVIRNISAELEDTEYRILVTKKEILGLHSKAWNAIYESIKKDIQEMVFPKIRRAFAAVNGDNPYAVRWGDSRFYFDLFPQITKAELFKERETLTKEYFGE